MGRLTSSARKVLIPRGAGSDGLSRIEVSRTEFVEHGSQAIGGDGADHLKVRWARTGAIGDLLQRQGGDVSGRL
jgi:hypothetical protein